jgi:hypothetical protein
MKSKYLELSEEDLAKVSKRRQETESVAIDSEQLFVAEFGKHYGWAGVMAILNNEIDPQTAVWLLQAARKVDARYMYESAQATFIGAGAAQSKKPSQTFKKATKDIVKVSGADL